MHKTVLIFEKLLGKPVRVEASGYTVEGILKHVEVSEHSGFGNIILQTPNGPILIRGSNVQTVSEVRMGHSPKGPMAPQPKIKTLGGEPKRVF